MKLVITNLHTRQVMMNTTCWTSNVDESCLFSNMDEVNKFLNRNCITPHHFHTEMEVMSIEEFQIRKVMKS